MKAVRGLLDRLSMYLPIFLMGVLALGTYWLVKSTPVLLVTPPEQPPKHQPDYFMKKFSVKTFDESGRLKSEIFGDEARHFPDTDTLEIDKVLIRSFNDRGQLTTASALRALTNGDASEVQLIGNAVVVKDAVIGKSGETSPRMTYRSEFLHAFMETERVNSHKPVELIRGRDKFTADTLVFDNINQVIELRGRVKSRIVPANSN
jgi:lipopolysaccharide export system protein LptC